MENLEWIEKLKEEVKEGKAISYEEANELYEAPLEPLCQQHDCP